MQVPSHWLSITIVWLWDSIFLLVLHNHNVIYIYRKETIRNQETYWRWDMGLDITSFQLEVRRCLVNISNFQFTFHPIHISCTSLCHNLPRLTWMPRRMQRYHGGTSVTQYASLLRSFALPFFCSSLILFSLVPSSDKVQYWLPSSTCRKQERIFLS